jgi:hypothetical protein
MAAGTPVSCNKVVAKVGQLPISGKQCQGYGPLALLIEDFVNLISHLFKSMLLQRNVATSASRWPVYSPRKIMNFHSGSDRGRFPDGSSLLYWLLGSSRLRVLLVAVHFRQDEYRRQEAY